MKCFILILVFYAFIFTSNSQTTDTIYVTEVDTVLFKGPDVILTQTFYQEQPSDQQNKKFEFIFSVGGVIDFSHYDVCKECETNFKLLKDASSNTKSSQLGLQINYLYKRFSFGVDLNYRNSFKEIKYSNDTLSFNSHLKVNYFMVGPSVSYKIFRKSKWEIDLYTGVLFSFTIKQSGQTMGDAYIAKIVNLQSDKLISTSNILYHFAPALTYNLDSNISLVLIAHYYFDTDSNVSNTQNYTEQRNTVGLSAGVKYPF